MEQKAHGRIIRDIGIVVISIIVALLLVRSGLIDEILGHVQGYYIIGAFVAGLFFTSAFTTAPAIVVLAKLSLVFPPVMVALVGALGSVIGDYVIFSFVKGHVSKDINYLLSHAKSRRIRHIFRYRFVKWSLAFLGALIIASPLPDELGLALMGMSKISTKRFILISYTFNALGILAIWLVARSLV